MGRVSKDKRDIYYRKAKEAGWRARSAFKLLQLDERYDLLEGVRHVVDLCAAPGSWSQVLSRRLYLPALSRLREAAGTGLEGPDGTGPENDEKMDDLCEKMDDLCEKTDDLSSHPSLPIIVAVDLQPMAPVEGVIQLQGDITSRATSDAVIAACRGELVDLIVCDGAPDVTGLHDLDEFVQGELIRAALGVAAAVLRPGGGFVAKIFRAKDAALLTAQLSTLFTRVEIAKPRSSRNSSIEAFVVCLDYQPPQGFCRSMLSGLLASAEDSAVEDESSRTLVQLAPFLACGDLSGWDPDRSYDLPDGAYVVLPAVQPPTAPAYAHALQLEGRR